MGDVIEMKSHSPYLLLLFSEPTYAEVSKDFMSQRREKGAIERATFIAQR